MNWDNYVKALLGTRKKRKQKGKENYYILLRKRGKPLILKKAKHQIGKVKSLRIDAGRRAKWPGKRKTKWGTVYYEYRKNRSDLKYNKKYKGWV